MCGYFNLDTQRMVIPRRFEVALPFREGLAAVRIKGKYGFIDATGQVVIKLQFDLAGAFYQGLAEVVVERKAGVIGLDGNFRISPQFARAIPFDGNIVIVQEGKSIGRDRLEGLDKISLFLYKNVGFYHIEKGWIVEPSLKLHVFTRVPSGLVWAAQRKEKGRYSRYGLMRADGTWKVEPRFTHVQSLDDEGMAVVSGQDPTGRKPKLWGAVDAEGKVIVPLIYDWTSSWRHGYGLAKKDGKHGLLDRTGKLVDGRFFDKVERATEKYLARVSLDGVWMSVSEDGALVSDQREGEIVLACPNGLTLKRESNLLAFYKPDGERVSNTLFDFRYYHPKNEDCSAPLSVSLDGKWGFITPDGRQLRNPLQFDNQYSFKEGRAWGQRNNLWGLIDDMGTFLIKPKYDAIHRHIEPYRVKKGDKKFFIDAAGQRVAPPPKSKSDHSALLKCRGGGRLVTENGKWGMVDDEGKVVIPVQHRALSCFHQGLAWAPVAKKKAWCPIGSDGRFHSNPPCKTRHYPSRSSHSFPERLSDDSFESSVLWSVAYLEYGAGKRDVPPKMIHEHDSRTRTSQSKWRKALDSFLEWFQRD